MKTEIGGRKSRGEDKRGKVGIALLLLVMGLAVTRAQNFSIDSFKIAGGGGTSTNSQYSLSGTIGQHDAGGPMAGGNYSLAGGFWSLVAAVQTPGSPLLSIFLTSTNTVVVFWPSPSTGFTLQQNSDLTTTNWVAGPAPIDNGVNKFVIVSPPAGNSFYRLIYP